ncbi:MAG: hypothetical protein H6Q41_5006 [Deltaproteobacteria bacterium]|jgi:hypothetical protein|nr:hypothetical protein [Deltaproteobacteria bacterium]
MFNIREGKWMKKGFVFKAWVYFLCESFLLLASGSHTMIIEAKELGRPLGEMVSRGEVKFEARKAVWKPVELSQFPIFQAVRIKTEKGASLITLENNSQIDVGENSFLSFDRSDQMHLTRGTIDFRLPSTAELSFKVGDLMVIPSKSLQVSKTPSAVSPKNEATIGSISVHPNGAVTVESLQGSLSVLNQGRAVLASLSSKDAITLPSVTVNVPSNVMVAQASEKTRDPAESSKFLGVPIWIWTVTISGVAIAAVAVIAVTSYHHGGGDGTAVPVCP